jgi:hypothetical protein
VALASSGCFETPERLERMVEDIGTSLGVCFTLARNVSLREDIGGVESGTAPVCGESLLDSQASGVGERLGAPAATFSSFRSTRLVL